MAAAIQPIEAGSVHRIQSGQVIVDLCSVVKELVENSLDAGATAIDVRFRASGLEAIEVQDNGSGISKENYASIALKHHTSKLRTFADLDRLSTFGFRGEALSSLCALADVHVVTATADEAPRGSRLDFELSGSLRGAALVATQRGTTVVVESVFKNLPVRQQDLRKNIKREFAKVVSLLQAYACISTGTKFAVTNAVAKKRSQLLATHANRTTRENVTNVFGAKAAAALTALDCEFEMQAHGRASQGESRAVKIQGHISRPVVGEGRLAPDRQMFFVNSRPCKLPQIAKALNDVYRGYNLNYSPFIFANVVLDTNAYDVNVSPDKREILLHDQDSLIESIKAAVTELFDGHQQTVPLSHKSGKLSVQKPVTDMLSMSTPASQGPAESRRVPSSPTPHSPEKGARPVSPMHVELVSSSAASSRARPAAASSPGAMIAGFMAQRSPQKADMSPTRASLASDDGPATPRRLPLRPDAASSPATGRLAQVEPEISMDDFDLAEDAAHEEAGDRAKAFTRRMRAQHEEAEEAEDSEESELPIRSVHSSPFKSSPGVVPNAFDRMRPYRTPKNSAAESGGWRAGQTMSTLGRTFKKQKTSNSGFSSSLRAFAAPGTQLNPRRSSAGSEASDQEAFRPAWPRRGGPNKPGRQTQLSPTRSSASESAAVADSGESDDEDLVEVSKGISTHRDSIASESHHSEDPGAASESASDGEWLDEEAKKAREDVKVQKLIRAAEEKAARPSRDSAARANRLLRGGHKDATTALRLSTSASQEQVVRAFRTRQRHQASIAAAHARQGGAGVAAASAEERLSLTVSKADFGRMRVVGQFNLGFILAKRSPGEAERGPAAKDELFIIDQHASDEKANFERLAATTVLQNQRLVQPLPLELTAVQRELVAAHQPALVRNGFVVSLHWGGEDAPGDDDDGLHAGPSPRATLLSLPASREVTFSVADLEELLALLPEDAGARPARVRRLLAMRACRSSIMVGRALTEAQMRAVVRSLGGLDKPWNCPHGRPTMRHLVGLGDWEGWRQARVDWGAWLEGVGDEGSEEEEGEDDGEGESEEGEDEVEEDGDGGEGEEDED